MKTIGCYKDFNLCVQSIIDRAYYSAITAVPESRVPAIEDAIKQVVSMEPSNETIELITMSTAGKIKEEDSKEKIINPNDDSGEMFVQIFVRSIIKLTNMLYKLKNPDDNVSIGRTVYSVCSALSETDNSIIEEYSSYDEEGNERSNVSDEGWISCALASISPSKRIRMVNACPDVSDLDFVLNINTLLVRP